MPIGMLTAQESSPPKIIRHSVAVKNSIEDFSPKDDGRYAYRVTSCGFHQSAAFQQGYTFGSLSKREGGRYWIQSLGSDENKKDPIFKQLGLTFGYTLVILSDFKDTQELRDQIEGFNLAMYSQMLIDYKKQADR